MPRASIVIRCFNEEAHIGRLLDGIMHQTMGDREVLVVDSGSTDATLDIASRYPVRVLTIRPDEFSFGRSLNAGCQAAGGEYVVIASAHTYPVYDDWLEQLLAPFADPQIALVYGRQRGDAGTQYSERQIFSAWFPAQSNPSQTHPFCNNANAAIRRALWSRWPYDEDLTGLEDLDWAHRILAQGYRLAYAANAEVVHVHRETWRQVFLRYRREAMALKRIFPHEHFRFWDVLRLVARNVASDYAHAARERALAANLTAIPTFRLMQFWGTYRGFAHRGPIPRALKQTFYYPLGVRRIAEEASPPRDGRAIDYDRIGAKETNAAAVRKLP
ncbi:MAG TPA: glycosyltransferase [bacterium]|jgi:glycosyltransferase involved in cell wall biosynthesis